MAAGVARSRSRGRAEPANRTVAALWQAANARPHERPAYLVETEQGWQERDWKTTATRIEELGHGLLALGIRKGDPFAILAATSFEWALVDFALALVGAVSAPIYPTSSAAECAYIVAHSESVGIFAEDEEQARKIESISSDAPGLQHVLSFAALDDLAAQGRRHRNEHPDALERRAAEISEDDVFTYQYTSGTTGPPKACIVRHRNYFEMVRVIDLMESFITEEDVMLLWLPLAHNFGRLLHLAGPYVGFTIAFLADPTRTAEVLPHVRPTVLPSAPRLYEKMYTAVRAQFDGATGVKRRLVDWALRTGYRASRLRQAGEALPPGLLAQQRIADRLVFAKVKGRLGGRLRFGISGAAPLSREIQEFFHALGVLILEGYGCSECTTACSVNLPSAFRFGSVGRPLPGSEIRIEADGEILIRSETVFAGYLKDEESTREVLSRDGWLRTGDVGSVDEDGFLHITDRKKDIIITAGGKNVAPQNLENALKASSLVSQALVIGDRRPYLVALLTLDPDEAVKWARSRGIDGDLAGLSADQRVRDELQRHVDSVNADLARVEQIKRFTILPSDFSADRGELTPTLKLKRNVVEEHLAEEIEALYTDSRE